MAEDKKAPQSALTQVDAVSTLPQEVRGDWVLFHPVYSQEEMESVQARVSSHFTFGVR
jgi:ubiquinol oxidase